MAVLPVDKVHVLVEQMQAEQPALMVYLLALEGYGLSQEEFEAIFYLGLVVWQMMKRGHSRLTSVTIEQLEQAEEENTKTLEFMEKDSEADFLSATHNMLETHPEPEVLRYIVEALMETDPEETELSEDGKGIAFLHLKTELEALARCLPT